MQAHSQVAFVHLWSVTVTGGGSNADTCASPRSPEGVALLDGSLSEKVQEYTEPKLHTWQIWLHTGAPLGRHWGIQNPDKRPPQFQKLLCQQSGKGRHCPKPSVDASLLESLPTTDHP